MADKYLKTILDKNDFLEAICLTDKEGIDVVTCYNKSDSVIKESQSTLIFVAAFVQTNENLTKLGEGKANSITLFYDNYLIYQESWNNVIINIFSKPYGNLGRVYEIAKDIKDKLPTLNQAVDKVK